MNNKLKKIITDTYKKDSAKKIFIPGKTPIPVSGKVFDEQELLMGVQAVLDGWWTDGKFAKDFEKKLAHFLNLRFISLVNSGSSANLIAFSALTSKSLGKRSIKPGDEVITVAASFPTTVNPIIVYNCIPVFVDVDLGTRNIIIEQVKKAITEKTRAIMIAHTLGVPFDVEGIKKIALEHDLWLIEDCCDALGSTYKGNYAGTFGDVATFSFYAAHQITMGEGGAVVTNNPLLHRSIKQFRDWGRDCWCGTGEDNTCKKRFGWKLGKLPPGYDHKYIFSQIGYNLKLTDMQAAIGLAQLEKLPFFIKKRKENFQKLYSALKKYEKYFILPEWEKNSEPCWFGFMLIIKDDAPFSRSDIVDFLEGKKVATRHLFSGNLLKHPAYLNIRHKKIGNLKNSDKIMHDGFWIGVYPGISEAMINYVTECFRVFLKQYE